MKRQARMWCATGLQEQAESLASMRHKRHNAQHVYDNEECEVDNDNVAADGFYAR